MMNLITNRIWADEGEILIDGESAPGNDRALGKVYMMAEANLFPDSMKWTGRSSSRAASTPPSTWTTP